jgi:hypothetical protein
VALGCVIEGQATVAQKHSGLLGYRPGRFNHHHQQHLSLSFSDCVVSRSSLSVVIKTDWQGLQHNHLFKLPSWTRLTGLSLSLSAVAGKLL